MAKPNPKHPALVTATESDAKSGLDRIIELSAKWQEPLIWTKVLEAAKEYRFHRAKISRLKRDIESARERRLLERLKSRSEDEQADFENVPLCSDAEYEKMQEDVKMTGSWSAKSYQKVIDSRQELIELKGLVRQYIRHLLVCVPDIDFGVDIVNESSVLCDFPDVDHTPLRRDLMKLEGEARVLSSGRRTASKRRKPLTVGQHRLKFYEARKAQKPQLTHKQVAALWCEEMDEQCDEGAFKQSIYRARKTRQ